MTGISEALSTKTGDSEVVIGSFKQVKCQAVGSDFVSIADFSNIREDVECSAGNQAVNAI